MFNHFFDADYSIGYLDGIHGRPPPSTKEAVDTHAACEFSLNKGTSRKVTHVQTIQPFHRAPKTDHSLVLVAVANKELHPPGNLIELLPPLFYNPSPFI